MGMLKGPLLGRGDQGGVTFALFTRVLRYTWGKPCVTLALFLGFLKGSFLGKA